MMARILVVDDEKSVRDVLVAELEKAKFEVEEADRGDAALTEAGNSKYDVALVDCQMQGGGTDLYKKLKKRFSDLLLIAMTDLGSKAEIERELVPPADAAWAKDLPDPEKKPPDGGIKVLVKLIHTLLEKKGGVAPE